MNWERYLFGYAVENLVLLGIHSVDAIELEFEGFLLVVDVAFAFIFGNVDFDLVGFRLYSWDG